MLNLPPRHRRIVEAPMRVSDTVVLVIGVVAAGAIGAVALVPGHVEWATPAIYSAVTLGAGTWLLTARRVASDPRWRRYLGCAIVLWGLGQLVVAVETYTERHASPSLGDVISVLAFPMMIVGITRAVRSEAFVRPVLRMTIDAVLMASASTLLVWRLTEGTHEHTAVETSVALGVLWLDAVVGCFGLLLFIRRPLRSTALLALGLATFGIADASTTLATLNGATATAVGGVLYCLGFTTAATGARIVVPEPNDGDDLARDLRQAVITMVITALVVTAAIAHIAVERRVPALELIVIGMVTVAAFFVRHFVDHHQRAVLLDQLTSQATHDALTGVGNRYALDDLGQRHATDEADVLVVGIDGLAAFTAANGHAESDVVLVRVANALRRRFTDALGIVRLDSDEFAIVVAQHGAIDLLAIAAQDAALDAVTSDVDSTVRLSVTSGASSGQHFDRDLFDPVGRAQRARHLASVTPNISVRVYDEQLRAGDERDRLIDERLVTAIPAGEITAHYQPIIEVASGRVVGVESLARWTDPLLGVVNPDEFIGRAEATGQIGALGICMLRQAVQAATGLGLDARDVGMGVNVSPSQLRRRYRDGGGFADKVAQVLGEAGMRPEALMVEVTESMLVEEHDPAIDELRRLSDLGVGIAIDDFGSGYWALGYFRWLDADIVKIDRSLVSQLACDARSRAVVASIVDLANRMGMRTIAEGVEDDEVALAAKELGVSALQGWAYSRAVPLVQLTRTIDLLDARPLFPTRGEPIPIRMH